MDNGNHTDTERQPRKKRIGRSRLRKTLMRTLIYGSAALLLLILVGFAVLRIPYIQDRIKTMAVVALERQLGVQLEWEELSGRSCDCEIHVTIIPFETMPLNC